MAKFARYEKVTHHGYFYDNEPSSVTFGQLIDPTTVTFRYREPEKGVTTLGVGTGVTRVAQGHFTAQIDYDTAGQWTRGWRSTGTGKASEPDQTDDVTETVLV